MARERAISRNAIVDSYMSILPSVQRKLMFEHVHVPKKSTTWRREGKRTPFLTYPTRLFAILTVPGQLYPLFSPRASKKLGKILSEINA